MDFEDKLQGGIYSGAQERTFIDKLLSRDDVNTLRELIKKEELTRSELLEILYLISGTESKLLNYSEWDRYVILKFFVWIREFIKIAEILYDYEDELRRKENTCMYCERMLRNWKNSDNMCTCKNGKPVLHITKRTQRLFKNNKMLIQHNAKFLVDLYLNIARTSMSVGGTGFLELLKNKYEVQYANNPSTVEVNSGGGLFGFGGSK